MEKGTHTKMQVITGILASISIFLTTVSVSLVLGLWTLQKSLSRGATRSKIQRRMDRIIIWWTRSNRWMIKRLALVDLQVTWSQPEEVSPEHWYLVISNHQSWTDILILQTVLLDRIPPLKFFTKAELIWIPFVGIAMHALGFPYVKRVSRAQIKADPSLRHADRDSVLAACEGFKNHPTSILNFVEGTRLTKEKHQRQASEFTNLLRPKAGGIDYILQGMEGNLHRLVDVTIHYPDGAPTFWGFLKGQCERVQIDIRQHAIPEFGQASERKSEVAQWVKSIWHDKDARLSPLQKDAQRVTCSA